MKFKNLERALKSFFTRYQTPPKSTQARLKAEAMASFRSTQNRRTMHRWVFWRRTSFSLVMVLCVAVVGIFGNSFSPNRVKAGKIMAEYGPVEIIRGESSFLVRDEADIFVGDLVRVGNRGIATLDLKNQAITRLNEQTHLRITDIDALFIEKGNLASEAFKGVEVATDRGLIRTTPGAIVNLEVSETGQTTVSPEKNLVQVFDLHDGQALLGQGEELILHSDTQLSFSPLPENGNLSTAQLGALDSKLTITRSKLLSAFEAQLKGQRLAAADEFLSAEQTFKSLEQVLLTSRELEIARRKNFDDTTVASVYPRLSQRVEHSGILAQVESLTQAFNYFQSQETVSQIELAETGDLNLDRYLLLKKIAEAESGPTQLAFEYLMGQYVVNFLQAIQNEPIRTDQVALLQEKVTSLPASADAYHFLRRVGQKMSPDLATALDQAIGDHF